MPFSTIMIVFKRTGQDFVGKNTFEMGAALAYYTVFSLAPLVFIAIAIAGLVYKEKAAEKKVADEIQNAVGPEMAQAIQQTLQSAGEGRITTASIIGITLLIFGASGVFVQLQTSLNTIWECERKEAGGVWGFIRTRLLSFAMVVGIGILLLLSLVVSTALSAMSSYVAPGQTALYQVLNQGLSFLLITVLFAALFKYMPDCQIDWEDVWIGATVTSLLFLIGKYLIGLYLAKGSMASAYGAAGSLVIVLVWVYYASQILLLGTQFTRVFATQRREAPAQVGGTRVTPA
jgi:membrane protein